MQSLDQSIAIDCLRRYLASFGPVEYPSAIGIAVDSVSGATGRAAGRAFVIEWALEAAQAVVLARATEIALKRL